MSRHFKKHAAKLALLDLAVFTRRSIRRGAEYTYDWVLGKQVLVEGTVAGQALPAVTAGQVCPAAVAVVESLPAPSVAEQVFPAADVVTVPADSTDAGRSGEASASADDSGETDEVDSVDEALFEAQTQAWLLEATLIPRTAADETIPMSGVPGFYLGPIFPGSPPPNWNPW